MPNLTDFLLARITEDERAARAAVELTGRWRPTVVAGLHGDAQGIMLLDSNGSGDEWLVTSAEGTDRVSQFDHIARHDPARVLAECEAKRRIIGRHQLREFARPGGTDPLCAHCRDHWPCGDLRDLAAVYADHPEYRDEWRP